MFFDFSKLLFPLNAILNNDDSTCTDEEKGGPNPVVQTQVAEAEDAQMAIRDTGFFRKVSLRSSFALRFNRAWCG